VILMSFVSKCPRRAPALADPGANLASSIPCQHHEDDTHAMTRTGVKGSGDQNGLSRKRHAEALNGYTDCHRAIPAKGNDLCIDREYQANPGK